MFLDNETYKGIDADLFSSSIILFVLLAHNFPFEYAIEED